MKSRIAGTVFISTIRKIQINQIGHVTYYREIRFYEDYYGK